MSRFIMILLLLVNVPFLLNAGDEPQRIKYGIYGDYSLNMHVADFNKIPDCPSCSPGYKSGIGSAFGGGLLVDFPLNNLFTFSLRADYYNFSGIVKRAEATTVIINGVHTAGEFEHSIDAKLSSLGLRPTLKINFSSNFYFNFGINAGYLLNKDYSQVEKITKPSDVGTFADANGYDTQSRTRNEFSGTLTDAAKLYLSLIGGVSYEFWMNDEFMVEPELSYFYGLNDIVNSSTVPKWKVNSLQVGIALKYSPKEKPKVIEIYKKEIFIDTIIVPSDVFVYKKQSIGKELSSIRKESSKTEITTIETIRRIDTVFVEKPYKFDGNITAVGVDKNGNEIPNPIFIIEEFVSNRLDPLLNYVFFEDNSSIFRDVYKLMSVDETSKFRIENLLLETTIDIYYNLLNIVGDRLIKYPKANITLVGCNSDIGNEKGNSSLSQKRAETVRDYLVNNWKIADNRIKIETKNLPSKPSTPIDEPDKIAENRRVEIYSDDYRIIEPVFIEKIDRTANPPMVRFKASVVAEAGLKNWQISATQNSDSKNKFTESGAGIIPVKVDWALEEFQKIIPKSPEPIVYTLDLVDNKGNNTSVKNQTLPIEVLTLENKRINSVGSYEIEKFSIILFDFDKSSIEKSQQRIVDFISKRINKESILEISGFTDRTGNDEYNKQLSSKRAEATKNALKRKDATTQANGTDRLLYNNDEPEGRFYCRTVQIIVKTPIK